MRTEDLTKRIEHAQRRVGHLENLYRLVEEEARSEMERKSRAKDLRPATDPPSANGDSPMPPTVEPVEPPTKPKPLTLEEKLMQGASVDSLARAQRKSDGELDRLARATGRKLAFWWATRCEIQSRVGCQLAAEQTFNVQDSGEDDSRAVDAMYLFHRGAKVAPRDCRGSNFLQATPEPRLLAQVRRRAGARLRCIPRPRPSQALARVADCSRRGLGEDDVLR
jgi:hypothetical protein